MPTLWHSSKLILQLEEELLPKKPPYGHEVFRMKRVPVRGICRVLGCKNPVGVKKALCSKCDAIIWRARHPVEAAYKMLLCSARKRRIPFKLTLDDFKELIAGTEYMEKKGWSPDSLHIDRIDPRKGYEVGNVQVITARENLAKREFKSREFARRGWQLRFPGSTKGVEEPGEVPF